MSHSRQCSSKREQCWSTIQNSLPTKRSHCKQTSLSSSLPVLVSMSCTQAEDHDVAFQNLRMLQGLGAAIAFFLGAVVCVAVKLYLLISLLILAILFYVVIEYQVRNVEQQEQEDDPDAAVGPVVVEAPGALESDVTQAWVAADSFWIMLSGLMSNNSRAMCLFQWPFLPDGQIRRQWVRSSI